MIITRPEDPECLREHANRIAAVVAANAVRMPVAQLDALLAYRDHLREQAQRLDALTERLYACAPVSAPPVAHANCRRCGTLFPVSDPQEEGHDCPACTDASCSSCGSYGSCRCWMAG